jgi:hypothetical protein
MYSQVVDRGDLRSYRTEIPNLIDDMDLSLPAFRLYIHLKRVAGERGASWEGVRRLADTCHMSVGTVRSAKAELEAAGLITIKRAGGEQADHITINDIWLENMMRYSDRNADKDDATEAPEDAEPATPTAAPRAPRDTPRAACDTPPRGRRHTPARLVTHKKEPMKKEPMKKGERVRVHRLR